MGTIRRKYLADAVEAATGVELDYSNIYIRTDYIGRGMLGNTCVAVELPNPGDMLPFMAQLGATLGADEELLEQLDDLAACVQQDQLGTGVVVYFPDFTDIE